MQIHQPLEVFQLSTLAELASLRLRWNQLAGDVPMRSWEWLEGWWRVYGNSRPNSAIGKELYLLAVFAVPDQLVAIAPWYIEHSVDYGRTLRFLGSGEVCTDYSTVLCEPGYERAVAEALARTLSDPLHVADWLTGNSVRHWDRIEFEAVDRDDEMMQLLLAELERNSNLVHRRQTQNCWRVNLPDSWDAYLAMLSKSHRKQLRRVQRDYFDTGRAVVHRIQSDDDFDHAWDLLVQLHKLRQRSLGRQGLFASERYTTFHRTVASELFRTGRLSFDWLEVDGRPLAIDYYLTGEYTIYAYQGGIDPDGLEHSPGQMLFSATVQHAIASGRRTFDLLRGDEPYKAHWRAEPKPVEDVRIIKRTPSNRVRHGFWVASDHVKNWIKTGLASPQRAYA